MPPIGSSTGNFRNFVDVEGIKVYWRKDDIAVVADPVEAVVNPPNAPSILVVLLAREDAAFAQGFEVGEDLATAHVHVRVGGDLGGRPLPKVASGADY